MNIPLFPKIGIKQGDIGVLGGIVLLGVFLLLPLASGFTQNSTARAAENPTDRALDISTVFKRSGIETLEDYLRWIPANLKYRAEQEDDWKYPINTLLSGYGDCEDLAFLHQAVLEHFGYEAKVLALGRGNKAHVFTLFHRGGQLYMLDNLKLLALEGSSADEAVRNLIIEVNASFLLQLDGEHKSVKILYSRQPLPLNFRIKGLLVT